MASDTESQLIQVCITGDLPTLKNIITKQGLNPSEVKDTSGLTLLHLACKHGHLDITQYLIREQNCNPETLTSNGRTPLHIACNSGHLHIVECLISEYKCNPHCTDNDGYTPLHAASESGDLDFIERNKTSAMAAKFNFSLQGTVLWIWQAIVHLLTILTQVLQRSTTTLSDSNNLLDQHRNASLNNQCITHHLDVVKYLITEHKCSHLHPNLDTAVFFSPFGRTHPLSLVLLSCTSRCLCMKSTSVSALFFSYIKIYTLISVWFDHVFVLW